MADNPQAPDGRRQPGPRHYVVLRQVHHGRMTADKIAAKTSLRRRTVRQALIDLQAAGYVQLAEIYTGDRWTPRLTAGLTAKGVDEVRRNGYGR